MTETIVLDESGDPSKTIELDEKDKLWIRNQKDEEIIDGRKKQGLKKLELILAEGKNKFKLKAKGHVGSIPLPSGNYIVNIRPKFKWANLFKLFEYTERIVPNLGISEVPAEEGDETLWDLFAKIFIRLTMSLIKTGLYRSYITKTEEITAIRGRLLIAQNIRHPQKFRTKHWCEFDELSYDVSENQCVLYCSTLLLRYVKNTKNKQELIRIRNIFLSQDVTLEHKVTYSDANSIILHRLNKRYETVIKYCKLILKSKGYSKFSKEGELLIPDFTISMWELFEKFTSQVLDEHYKDTKTYVDFNKTKYKHAVEQIPQYDDPNLKYGNPPELEPDNVIMRGTKKLILDTKWKPKVSDKDWYQAISYSLGLKCDTILLHPKDDKKISDGFKIIFDAYRDLGLKIHIKTIDFEQAAKTDNFIKNLQDQIEEIVDRIELK